MGNVHVFMIIVIIITGLAAWLYRLWWLDLRLYIDSSMYMRRSLLTAYLLDVLVSCSLGWPFNSNLYAANMEYYDSVGSLELTV